VRWDDKPLTVAVRGDLDPRGDLGIDYTRGRASVEAGRIVSISARSPISTTQAFRDSSPPARAARAGWRSADRGAKTRMCRTSSRRAVELVLFRSLEEATVAQGTGSVVSPARVRMMVNDGIRPPDRAAPRDGGVARGGAGQVILDGTWRRRAPETLLDAGARVWA